MEISEINSDDLSPISFIECTDFLFKWDNPFCVAMLKL